MRKHSSVVLGLALSLAGCQNKKDEDSTTDTTATTLILPGALTVLDPTSGTSGVDGDAAACQDAADGLAPAELLGMNADPDHVTTALRLPAARPDDVLVSWTSGHTAISAAGKITRPVAQAGDATGTLEATFTKGNARILRAYAFIVLHLDVPDSDSVAADKAALVPAVILGANASVARITTALTFPGTGAHGTTITWASANAAINAAGAVARPAASAAQPSVAGDVVATIARNNESDTVTFHAVVLRELAPLLITEIYAGTHTDDGWVEVVNTTARPIDLAQYGWRSCDAFTCGSIGSGALPAVTVAAGHYILLHPDASFASVSGPEDAFLSGFQLDYRHHFFELTKAGATVDFVRWASAGETIATNPSSGSFTDTAVMTSGLPGKSLARPWPHDDTDRGADWTFVERATPGGPNGTGAVLGTDSDGDGLTDDYEINVSHTDPHNSDTDGDGFSDGQEVLENGFAGINLKALGADPNVRDLFVELDYMAPPAGQTDNLSDSTANAYSLRLRKGTLDRIKAVFDDYAPPAGGFPIKIHLDAGHLFNPGGALSPENYDLGGGNEIPFERCLSLGHDGTHTVANCADLYLIKQQNFESARRYIFHYFIVGWSQQADGSSGSSGLAEVFGNDGIMTLGSWGYDASVEQKVVNFQAATLLHELGHNLGLQHGGDEGMNYKPNYLSSMNYTYQLEGLDTNDNGDIFYRQFYGTPAPLQTHPLRASADNNANTLAFVLGYSHGARTTLDEHALNETTGWNGVAIDFSFDAAKSSTSIQNNIQPATYNSANTDILHDYDDWSHLDLKFQERLSAELNGISPYGLTDPDEDKQPVSIPCLERPFD